MTEKTIPRKREANYSEAYENTTKRLTKKQYLEVLTTFNKLLVGEMLQGKRYVLPFFLGSLSITKNIPRKKVIYDYGYFRKTGEKIQHKNWHSEGYTAGFFWDKRISNFPTFSSLHRSLFKFKAAKAAKQDLKNAIINDNAIIKFHYRDEVYFNKSSTV